MYSKKNFYHNLGIKCMDWHVSLIYWHKCQQELVGWARVRFSFGLPHPHPHSFDLRSQPWLQEGSFSAWSTQFSPSTNGDVLNCPFFDYYSCIQSRFFYLWGGASISLNMKKKSQCLLSCPYCKEGTRASPIRLHLMNSFNMC